MDASAKTNSANLERIERDIKRVEAEQHRRMMLLIASGEATCLRAIVHEGEDEDEVCARVRAEAGLPEGRDVVFIVRKIVPPSEEFLQQQARQKAESDAIRDARYEAQDEWRPSPRAMIPDHLDPVQISAVIDDELYIPIVGHYVIVNGDLILTDARGKPLGNGRYARPLHPDARPDRIARSLLIKFDLERGKGERELNYPQRPVA
jgi:hypothetical protein